MIILFEGHNQEKVEMNLKSGIKIKKVAAVSFSNSVRLWISLGLAVMTAVLVGGLISIGGVSASLRSALLGPLGYAMLSMGLVVFLIAFFEGPLLMRFLIPFKLLESPEFSG